MYSVGVILYALIALNVHEVFSISPSVKTEETHRASLDFSEQEWDGYSSELKDFIAQCLEVDTMRRPTVEELLTYSNFMLMYS